MAIFDILLTVTNPYVSDHIGHSSKYSTSHTDPVPHPGTGNKIEGWKWDEARWPSYSELSGYAYIPALFDSGDLIPEKMYQSGFGYEDDIKMNDCTVVVTPEHVSTNPSKKFYHKEFWTPQINVGNYYIYNKEWYLFSDQYATEALTITTDGIADGLHSLGYRVKDNPFVPPVFVRRFARNEETSRLYVVKELQQHIHTGTAPDFDEAFDSSVLLSSEFYLDVDTDPSAPPKIITSPALSLEAGTETFVVTSETKVISLESFPVNITSVTGDGAAVSWEHDNDLGHVQLPEGHGVTTVVVNYAKTYSVIYEPYFATETISALPGNVNPLHNGTNRGFVQITTEILDPFTIELVSDLPSENNAVGGPSNYILELGNNVGKLIATVKNKIGSKLEGVRVYFDWDLPEDLSSITDYNGEAFMYYNSPNSINDIGEYFTESGVTYGPLTTEFTSSNIPIGTSTDEIWIFALYHTDEFFGLEQQASVNSYYETFLQEEGFVYSADEQANEIAYRKSNFPDIDDPGVRPISIADLNDSAGDNTKGQKRLLLKLETDPIFINSSDAIRADEDNPVWWPVHPFAYSSPTVIYRTEHLPDATRGEVNSYFIVSNQNRQVRAYAINHAGERVYSNTIIVKITIPDSFNGTFHKSILQEPYVTGLLMGDQTIGPKAARTDLDTYWYSGGSYELDDGTTPSTPPFKTLPDPLSSGGKIPVGFRIKTQGVTVASFLNQVTFINPHGQGEEPPEPDPT